MAKVKLVSVRAPYRFNSLVWPLSGRHIDMSHMTKIFKWKLKLYESNPNHWLGNHQLFVTIIPIITYIHSVVVFNIFFPIVPILCGLHVPHNKQKHRKHFILTIIVGIKKPQLISSLSRPIFLACMEHFSKYTTDRW